MIQKLTETQNTLEDTSKHQESLQYVQSHNRGGLTNITDGFYEFTLAMETSCKQHFTIDAFHNHKWNACKVVRDLVKMILW